MFYSQCLEDKIIFEKYLSKIHIDKPVYLEMGAMTGIEYSNTYFFEKYHNWTGILIEPHKYNFELLTKNRPNNKLFNELVSNEENELEYINYNNSTLSGVAGVLKTIPKNNMKTYYEDNNPWQTELRKKYLKIQNIKPVTLTSIIKQSGFDKIDFFSLDVEGHEYQVLLSFDWSIPVNIFLIENNPDRDKINKLLISKNYVFIEHVGPNSLWFLDSFIKNNNTIL